MCLEKSASEAFSAINIMFGSTNGTMLLLEHSLQRLGNTRCRFTRCKTTATSLNTSWHYDKWTGTLLYTGVVSSRQVRPRETVCHWTFNSITATRCCTVLQRPLLTSYKEHKTMQLVQSWAPMVEPTPDHYFDNSTWRLINLLIITIINTSYFQELAQDIFV